MRRFLLLAVAAGLSVAAGMELGAPVLSVDSSLPIKLQQTVAGALKSIEDVKLHNAKLQSGIPPMCDAEISATEKWIKDGSGIDASERDKNKAQLSSALGDRVKGLSAFLGRLKKMRSKLRSHIVRINDAFTAKNLENKNAMRAAMSASRATKGLPLLMLPSKEQDRAEDKKEEAMDEPSEDGASLLLLLEVEGRAAVRGVGEREAALKLAAAAKMLYQQAFDNVKMTKADLEVERGILGKFRDLLRAMILKREAKLAKLTAQLKSLNQQIGEGGSFDKDVFPLLDAHLTVVKSWRSGAPGFAKESADAEDRVITAIKTGRSTSSVVEAGKVGGAAGGDAAGGSDSEWKTAPSDSAQGGVSATFAVGGYSEVDFAEAAVGKALASALASQVSVKAADLTVGKAEHLTGDNLAVKVKVAFKGLGAAELKEVQKKVDEIATNPSNFVEKLKSLGASKAEAVTVMSGPVKAEDDDSV